MSRKKLIYVAHPIGGDIENNIIDEMWIYGLSNGVNQEIEWCKEFNIPYIFV